MTFAMRSLALAGAFVLASCGGGGGGAGTGTGGIGGGGPQAVAINETSAKPVAASAMDATQNTSATSGATLPVGVQVDAAAHSTNLQVIAEAARRAAASFSAANLPAGVAINETDACGSGGTVTISGNVAGANGISTGDTLNISFSNCAETVGTQLMVMNGQMSVTIAGGSIGGTLPFHVVMNVTATNLSSQFGGVTNVSSGDVRLDWTATNATSQILTASGTSMQSRSTVNGATRTNTMRNYSQTLTVNGSTLSGTLSATIETDNSRLGSSPVTYTVTTPSPLAWNASTRLPTAGVVKVVGASNSQLVATFNADGSVTIQVDANGDNTFEKTVTSTGAELSGLR
jgi:hypothetical protein